MVCFHLRDAWPAPPGAESKRPVFSPFRSYNGAKAFSLPCNGCIGCRAERASELAGRAVLEARCFDRCSFLTLTYDDAHLPAGGGVSKREMQLFLKRLRLLVPEPVRYMLTGEYGDQRLRPHYHVLCFGEDFAGDRALFKRAAGGDLLYTSRTLDAAWGKGLAVIGDFNASTAGYVARYCHKKLTGEAAEREYLRYLPDGQPYWVEPVFGLWSRRPGIGATWCDRYWDSDAKSEFVIIEGRRVPMPRYITARRFRDEPEELLRRQMAARQWLQDHPDETHWERVLVREESAALKLARKVRELEA